MLIAPIRKPYAAGLATGMRNSIRIAGSACLISGTWIALRGGCSARCATWRYPCAADPVMGPLMLAPPGAEREAGWLSPPLRS